MALKDSFTTIRYFTSTDVYYYTTDNRPLTDLKTCLDFLGDTLDAGFTTGFVTFNGSTLISDAANILAQRNGVNAQALRIYNTFTDSNNYERGFSRWSGNVYEIGTEAAGTGTTRNLSLYAGGTSWAVVTTSGDLQFTRTAPGPFIGTSAATDVRLGTSNTTRWIIQSAGHLVGNVDNTYDIGADGATRPRSAYFGTSIISPLVIGGSAAAAAIELRTTSGTGAGSDFVKITGGTNGGTEITRFLRASNGVAEVLVGTTAPINSAGYQGFRANGSSSGFYDVLANGTRKGSLVYDTTATAFGLYSIGSGTIAFGTNTDVATLKQFEVLHTASANRNATVTGSNGGNPVIGASAGTLATTMGGGTGTATLVGVSNVNTTSNNNTSTGETDLTTYTLPASSLNANNKGVRITAWGTCANNANAKTVKAYFGAVLHTAPNLTASQISTWRFEFVVLRTGSNAQAYMSMFMQGGTTKQTDEVSGTLTQTDTGTIVIKITGTGGASSDITQQGMTVEFLN